MMTRIRVALSFLVLALGALVMLIVAIPTLGLARRFYSEVIGRAIGVTLLRLWGVQFKLVEIAPLPTAQAIYVSNHSSTIDMFVLIALALPRTRFFLSGFLRTKIPPLGVIGYLIRIFWTVPQEFPQQRRMIFTRAARILRRSGDSVYLSPEGERVVGGKVGPFNKGSFHMATDLRVPIVPLYFQIPAAIDPGMGYHAAPGTVNVYALPAIDTSDWTLDEISDNRHRVRELFVRVNESLRTTGMLPKDLGIPRRKPLLQLVAS